MRYIDYMPEGCVERLKALQATPALKVTIDGGGLQYPAGSVHLVQADMLLISRGEVADIIRHLTQWIETKGDNVSSFGSPPVCPELTPHPPA